jgi:thiamine-phosphate pyrophosphorylase
MTERNVVFPPLYAIIDADLLNTSELAFAEMLVHSGVELLQYRNKRVSPQNCFQVCRNLMASLRPPAPRLIVNDRADIAALAGAGGVHVGQEDLEVEQARALCPHPAWVGVSTHTLEQVRHAATTSADYVAVGPIFATTTKRNPEPVVGTDFIRRARALTGKPLVAIGGITLENAEQVYSAGADCLAVARDLLVASDPAQRARDFMALFSHLAGARTPSRN